MKFEKLRRAGAAAAAALGVAVLLWGAPPASAQSTSGKVSGVVRDAAGRPVAGAPVEMRSLETGKVRSTACDGTGHYRFDSVEPGTWVLVARGPDGTLSDSRSITVNLQDKVQVDLKLGAGLVEEVDVEAEAPIVDPERTGGELRVTDTQINAIPVAGRELTQVALLDASVRPSAPASYYGEQGAVFVINGQSGRSNGFFVDGLDNNDQLSGTGLAGSFSQLVVRDVVVLTHQYSAEFGRASGGIFNIVTARGTNDLETNLFFQGSASSWNSAGELVNSLPKGAESRDTVGRINTGFSLGGPFQKDKAFYFVAFEHGGEEKPIPYTGTDRDGVHGGVYDGSNRTDTLFFRTDVNIDTANTLMLRVSADDSKIDGMNVGGTITPEFGWNLRRHGVQLAGSLTTILSPTAVHELRLLLGTGKFDQEANSGAVGVERPGGSFGGNNLNQQLRDEDRLQIVGNLSLQRRNHALKLGYDVTRSKTRVEARFNPNGNFIYQTDKPYNLGDCQDVILNDVVNAINAGTYPMIPCQAPGGGPGRPADISTYPVAFSLIEGQPDSTLNDTRIALFAQDSYQVNSKLLLDYGLRYDLSTFALPKDAKVESTIPNGGAGRDYDNLAPRLAFTYTPGASKKTVIRGGAGVFYDKLVLAFPAVAAVTSGTRIGILPPQGFTFEFTEKDVEEKGIDYWKPLLLFPDSFVLRFSTGTRLDTPYSVQYNLGVERSVKGHGAWSVNAVQALGYHLPLMRDLNPVVQVFRPEWPYPGVQPDLPTLPIHRDNNTGSIAAVTTEGRSWYRGLDLGWRWQGENGWHRFSYTWSKAEDLGPDPLKNGIYLPPTPGIVNATSGEILASNSDNLMSEKARSDNDRRHRFVASGEMGLPWLGLRLSGVFQFMSGAPFNVTTGGDENVDGITTDRPDGIGRNTGDKTPLDLLNAFRVAKGLPAVTSLHEPSFVQIDARLSRPFAFGQRKGGGEVYLQVFNLLNRYNPGPIEGRARAANFGQPIGQIGPPRTFELGMRLSL